MTPFEALYGRTPPSLSSYVPGSSKVGTLDELLSQRAQILKVLKFNLNRARNRMEQQAILKRTEKFFEEGDWVYLKLQPYRQISVKNRASPKLAKRFYGPFKILRRVGVVAYELDLPAASRVHPVFHVSLLKPCHGTTVAQVSPLPMVEMEETKNLTPFAVLDSRWVSNKKGARD